MGTFAAARVHDLPPHLQGPDGEGLAVALGNAQDAEMPLLRVAAVADLPALAPDDAFSGTDTVGNWFAIERYEADTDDSYRARVSEAFATWREAGSPQAVIDSLRAFGLVDIAIVPVWQTQYAPETISTSYSEFYVILGPDFGTLAWTSTILGSCVLGSCTLGSSATGPEIVAVKRQILKWKAAHGYPIKIMLDFGAGPSAHGVSYPIGRTLGDTMPVLGDPGCILGGYIV